MLLLALLLNLVASTNITCGMISMSSLGQSNVIAVSSTAGDLIYKNTFDIYVSNKAIKVFSIPRAVGSVANIGFLVSSAQTLNISITTPSCPLGVDFTINLFAPSCSTILTRSNGSSILMLFMAGTLPAYSMTSNNDTVWFQPVTSTSTNYFARGFAKSGRAISQSVVFNLTTSYCLGGKQIPVLYSKPSCSDLQGGLQTIDNSYYKVVDYVGGIGAYKIYTNDERFTLQYSTGGFQLTSPSTSTNLTVYMASRYCMSLFNIEFIPAVPTCANCILMSIVGGSGLVLESQFYNMYMLTDSIGNGGFQDFNIQFQDPTFKFRIWKRNFYQIFFEIANNNHFHAALNATLITPYCTQNLMIFYYGNIYWKPFPSGTPLPWTTGS